MMENMKNIAIMMFSKFIITLAFASNLITWPIQMIYFVIKYQHKKSKGQEELDSWLNHESKKWETLKIMWHAVFCIWDYYDFVSLIISIDI